MRCKMLIVRTERAVFLIGWFFERELGRVYEAVGPF
jgi:hypothetical protein